MNDDHKKIDPFGELDADAQEKLKQIVVARIRTLPQEMKISLGGEDLSAEQLVQHVEEGDETGLEYLKMNLLYMQELASGAIYNAGSNE